jgi:hypothetical protein
MYIKACEAGMGSACNKGAVIIDTGTFVNRDADRAMELYGKACDGGAGDGCTGLGRLLEESDDKPSDYEAARMAYERGIALGSVEALREQARMLWRGYGGKKRRIRARKLASEACQKGDAIACSGAEAL